MAITYRKDLDRVLTADEVDANFLELDTRSSVDGLTSHSMRVDLLFPDDEKAYKVLIGTYTHDSIDALSNGDIKFFTGVNYNVTYLKNSTINNTNTHDYLFYHANNIPAKEELFHGDYINVVFYPSSDGKTVEIYLERPNYLHGVTLFSGDFTIIAIGINFIEPEALTLVEVV